MDRPLAVGSLSGARVLLVDDDDAVRLVVAKTLTRLGCDVVQAPSGNAALALLGASVFDAVCSDIHMPAMNGVQLLRAIRQQDLDVPVVLLTGMPGVDTATEAVHYGAIDYLTKPIVRADLERSMSRAVALGRMARAKREAMPVLVGGHGAGDRAGLEVSFESALRSLSVAYQPILTRDGALYGHEALLRCAEPALPHPDAVLAAAEALGRSEALARQMRSFSAEPFTGSAGAGLLFVNVFPHDLFDQDLVADGSALASIADRVVLEITERASLARFDGVHDRVRALQAFGYRIAIDDLGAGHAGLASFVLLEPDYVKLDVTMVKGIDSSRTKQRIVKAMIDASHDLGILVLAEGVETVVDRDKVIDSGCDLLQGFLFAHPGPAFPAWQWPARASA